MVASLDNLELDEQAAGFLKENHIGNIVHFGNTARDRAQVAALNRDAARLIEESTGVPPLITIDHEGGRVMRFSEGITWFPSAMAIGASGSEDLAYQVGRAMGAELRAVGIHLNFAPVLDVNSNARNPVIGVRSFGDDPARVGRLGAAMARGMQEAGLLACGKHFPGHGDTEVDSHLGLPRVEKTLEALRRVELAPFAEAIRAGLSSVMTSHILYPALESLEVPATMSGSILLGLLRGQMGFDGLILSDGMQMQAIAKFYGVERGCVEAVKQGCDLLCIGTAGQGWGQTQAACCRAVLKAAESGEIPMARIDDSVARVLRVKEKIFEAKAPAVDWAENAALSQQVADASVAWVRKTRAPLAGRILCVSRPAVVPSYGVEEGDWRTKSFAQIAAKELGGDFALLGQDADEGALDRTDTLVIGIGRVSPEETELRWVREALSRKKRVAVVLTDLPYAAGRLPEGCATLCIFGMTFPSVKAACRALRGEIPGSGRVPVRM